MISILGLSGLWLDSSSYDHSVFYICLFAPALFLHQFIVANWLHLFHLLLIHLLPEVLSIEMMWEASWLLVALSCKMAKTLANPRSFVVKVVFLHCLIEQSCLCRAKRQGHVLRLVHLLHSLPTGATIAWDCKPAIAVDNCTFWAEQTFPSIIWQQRPTRKKSLVPIFYSFPFLLCSDHLLTKQVFSFVILH